MTERSKHEPEFRARFENRWEDADEFVKNAVAKHESSPLWKAAGSPPGGETAARVRFTRSPPPAPSGRG